MGNYDKTIARIEELQTSKRIKLERISVLRDEISDLQLDIADIDVQIGENRGYLRELEEIDGGEW